jgi:hypothetical protein
VARGGLELLAHHQRKSAAGLRASVGDTYMPLSEAQIRDFYANGFVVVRQLAPRSAVEAVLAAGLAKRQWGLDGEGHQTLVYSEPLVDAGVHALLHEPEVYGAAAQLLGSAARVYYAFFAVVPGGGGTGLPWCVRACVRCCVR